MKTQSNLVRRINPEIYNTVVNGTPEQRVYICRTEPLYFLLYYFPDYFEYALDDYHYLFIEDFRKLIFNEAREVQWIAFRESAKTTLAKLLLTWVICYRHKSYISYGSYEKENAEAALFDITVWLQTNKRIIADFGFLYKRLKKKDELEESQLKQKARFITNNKIRIIAFSTQESTRGHIYDKYRPDFYVYDDFENNKTKDSHAVTAKIISHFDEARSGIGTNGGVLYLCNYIRDDGSVEHIKQILENMDDGIVRNIPIKNEQGIFAWKDKYVETKIEARILNEQIDNPRKFKVALEKKREDLGDAVYFTELMNNPGKSGDYYFDREKVRAALELAKPPIRTIGEMEMWAEYDPSHRYALGADTAEGIGSDSSATGIIDFTRSPALLVASFANNQIKSKVFAHEISREGRRYGECFVVPEVNNGYGTTSDLVDPDTCNYPNVYIRQVKNKTTKKFQNEFGFNTNSKTKPDILSHFKSAFEDGNLEILDKGLLKEMMYFRKADAYRIKEEEGATRHFDKLMAACFAWEGRKFATAKESDDDLFISPQTKEANALQ